MAEAEAEAEAKKEPSRWSRDYLRKHYPQVYRLQRDLDVLEACDSVSYLVVALYYWAKENPWAFKADLLKADKGGVLDIWTVVDFLQEHSWHARNQLPAAADKQKIRRAFSSKKFDLGLALDEVHRSHRSALARSMLARS